MSALAEEGGVRTAKVTPESSRRGSSPLYLTMCPPRTPLLEVGLFLKSKCPRQLAMTPLRYSLLLVMERGLRLIQAMEELDQIHLENVIKLEQGC